MAIGYIMVVRGCNSWHNFERFLRQRELHQAWGYVTEMMNSSARGDGLDFTVKHGNCMILPFSTNVGIVNHQHRTGQTWINKPLREA